MLSEDQVSMDRADIIARVFHLKKEQLMHEIFNDGIFGKCPARVWTIEYQKRGLADLPGGLRPLSRARRRGRDGVRGGAVGHDPWSLPQSPGSLNGGTKRYTRNFCEETSVGEDGFQECHLRGLACHHRGLLA